ncbi:ankyrin repeat domain-containing protein 26-like [Sciurus carolinensis]|uniref:ankyrin repeat domain-containing protein 26-like n=1 Tax=Sciurus carolinensis TaxID=30640 RepID=UPI001FB564AB|nr:ankyrin repeat domain-containing protein 26-like [Sciurus carolinensis]
MTSEKRTRKLDRRQNIQSLNVPKVNQKGMWETAQQSRRNKGKYAIGRSPNISSVKVGNSERRAKGMAATPPETSTKIQRFPNPSFPNAKGKIISEILQQNSDDYFSEEEDRREKYIVHGNVEEFYENCYPLKHTFGMTSFPNKAVGKKDAYTFKSESDLEESSYQQKNLDSSESNELVEKEMKQRRRNVTKRSENLCDSASPEEDDDGHGDGVHRIRKSRKADFQLLPIKRNKVPKDGPALCMKEVKKNKNEEWVSRDSVILAMFRRPDSLPGGLLQVKDDYSLSETLQSEGRPAKKTSNEKNKVSISYEKANDLMHKMDMLQDEIAMLKLERETKNQTQEKEKKYLEHIESLEEKVNDFQKTVKLKEETMNQMRAEIAVLKFNLESGRHNNERKETDIGSNNSRLANASRDCDQTQTSKRDLEHASQRGRDEHFHLQDEMNAAISNLGNESERKFSGLENKLHLVRDDVGKNTLILEHLQRDVRRIRCQMKETECVHQNEQRKASNYVGKKEYEEERSSQLQSENTLLHQVNEVGNKDKIVVNMQDQFHDVPEKVQHHMKTPTLTLKERNKESDNKSDHLQEKVHQYKNVKAERSLLEDRNLDEKDVEFFEKLRDLLQKLQLENSTLKLRVKNQTEVIEQLQNNLVKVKLELSSKKNLREKCEKLEEENSKLIQELTNLKKHTEELTKEHSQIEKYKQDTEERAKKELTTKLKQVNLLLQKETENQEHLDALRKTNMDAQRSKLELQIKELESEVLQTRTKRDSTKIKLQRFKQLYREERKTRKSLSSEVNYLHRTIDILTESNSRLLEMQQNSSDSTRPPVDVPHERDLHGLMATPTSYAPYVHQSTNHCINLFQHNLHNLDTETNEALDELQWGTFQPLSPSPSTKSRGKHHRKTASKQHRY